MALEPEAATTPVPLTAKLPVIATLPSDRVAGAAIEIAPARVPELNVRLPPLAAMALAEPVVAAPVTTRLVEARDREAPALTERVVADVRVNTPDTARVPVPGTDSERTEKLEVNTKLALPLDGASTTRGMLAVVRVAPLFSVS